MKYLLILIALALLLTGCGDVTRTHYVYPSYVEKAVDFCAANDGIDKLVIIRSNRPAHINAGAWGYVECNNTARFEFHALIDGNDWDQKQ